MSSNGSTDHPGILDLIIFPTQLRQIKTELMSLLYLEKLNAIQKFGPVKRLFTRWWCFIEHTFMPSQIASPMHLFKFTDWYLKAALTIYLGRLRIPADT